MRLLGYELQKMVTKRTNQIVMLLLAILVAYFCRTAIRQVEWIDETGKPITGYAAAVKLRQESEEWTGMLDQSLLEKSLIHIKEIYSTSQSDSLYGGNNWVLQNKLQGVKHIADLLGSSYVDEFDTYEEMITELQPEDLSRFYENRLTSLSMFLNDEGNWGSANYTKEEKQYITDQYCTLQVPFEVGYQEGWVQVSKYAPSLMKYCIILLSFSLAGIFSDEFMWKTDSVYYNTYHGRTKSVVMKLLLGFLTITLVYWLCMGSFSIVVLRVLGTNGANHFIQSCSENWNIRYSMTFRQYYCLILGAGYLGFLFFGFLIMWVSAKTKSSVFAVLVPPSLLLLPMFLHEIYNYLMRKAIGLLPHWLVDITQALRYQYLYKVGRHITCLVPIILILYSCLTVALIFLCYREYRHKQIA